MAQSPIRKKNLWPRQEALVVSDSSNIHMMLRELVRGYQWKVMNSTSSTAECLEGVRTGAVSLVIVDDSQNLPAIRAIRALMLETLGVLTPVLAMMAENSKNEIQAIKQIGRPEIMEKPLTPSKFVPAFVALIRAWEREPFLSLRHAALEFLDNNGANGIRILNAQLENKETYPFAARALALRYRAAGRIKEGESILLSAFKRNPRNISLIFSLVDLYNAAAMPHLAKKFLQMARTSHISSHCMIPDMVQTAIALGQLDEAIRHLMALQHHGQIDEKSTQFLARLLWAEGREADAERILGGNKNLFKKLVQSWQAADSGSLNNPSLAS